MDQHHPRALRVTIRDLRDARYCLAGVRPWFRRHGLDWQEFLDHGIAAEQLRATGDALVEPVIRIAEMRAAAVSSTTAATARDATPTAGETRDGR